MVSAETGNRSELSRTITLFKLFRREAVDPAPFYTFLAEDTVERLAKRLELNGSVVLDIGGGPGYVASSLRRAGARCIVAEYAREELFLHGCTPEVAVQADGQAIPIRAASVDVCHSSNVLEHVPEPRRMLDEMVRVVRPGGLVYLSFTNWFSPWGGHETSPWHYLGGEYAARRWEAKHARPAKNRYGQGLFRLDIAPVLAWIQQRSDVEVLSARSRYLPSWMTSIVRVPGLRELAIWNLEVILRRR